MSKYVIKEKRKSRIHVDSRDESDLLERKIETVTKP